MDTPLLHLDPDDPPLVVARLPDHAPLPFPGACRDVSLTHDVLTHVVQRRLKDGDAQVSLVLRRMREVLQAPTHWGRLTADPRRIELYARVSWDDPAGVVVSVKFVHAGESWVNTAYPIGVDRLVRYLRVGRLLLLRDPSRHSSQGG